MQRASPDAAFVVKSDAMVIADLEVVAPTLRLLFARVRTLCHIVLRGRTDLLTLAYTRAYGLRRVG